MLKLSPNNTRRLNEDRSDVKTVFSQIGISEYLAGNRYINNKYIKEVRACHESEKCLSLYLPE